MLDTETEHPTRAVVVTEPPREVGGPERPLHDAFTPPARSGSTTSASGSGLRRFLPGGGGGGGRRRPAHEADDDREKLDVRNSWQVAAGSILIPLGVIFILLSWYGAAHSRVVQQQIPYLVSGSFIGLGCMVVGGLLFFGHWLYRIWDQADLQHEERLRVMEDLVRVLTSSGTGAGAMASLSVTTVGEASTGVGAGGGVGAASPVITYFATATGTVFHLSDCPVISHHSEDLRVLGPEARAGMRPCQICTPPET